MARFQSLLIDQARIRLPGLAILRVALHRHLPDRADIGRHRHPWSQALLYLGGGGRQVLGRREAAVGEGTVVLLPPRLEHGFVRSAGPAPTCLMFDFRLDGDRQRRPTVAALPAAALVEVRQRLAQVRGRPGAPAGSLRWEGEIAALQILVQLLRAGGWVERLPARTDRGAGRALAELMAGMDPAQPLTAVVKRSGYQRDHLNRLLKRSVGLTLGQMRATRRLEKASELLVRGVRVADVAAAVGLPDQSYFSRWFRRQTGQRPTEWSRQRMG